MVIPSLMRDLTGGQDSVDVTGETVAAVIEALDAHYPGIRGRLCLDDDLDPALVVAIDRHVAPLGLNARVPEGSEVRFLPALGGG